MNPLPDSIRAVNALPEALKIAHYRTLLPDWLLAEFSIDPETLTVNGQRVVHFRCPEGSRAFEVSVYRHAADIDPMLYLNMADTFNNQLLVLLVVSNNPDEPRFNIDIDLDGNRTQLGTVSRNIPAEKMAMQAGLAPGQVRAGMRVFRRLVPVFEQFVARLGQTMFFIEPLAYHNAIVFERYGFNYVRGYQEMVRIDREFCPGGELHARLTPDNPFRLPDAWESVRGRSWAIHDGILGHPFTGFQMYKRLGVDAQKSTFSGLRW